MACTRTSSQQPHSSSTSAQTDARARLNHSQKRIASYLVRTEHTECTEQTAGTQPAQTSSDMLKPHNPQAPVGSSDNPSFEILTLANCITFARLLLTLVFLALFSLKIYRIPALICYIVAAVTDFLDGQVARRTQTVSWLGKIMDPIMDRVLLVAGVIGLVVTEEVPVWIAVYVIGRDMLMAYGSFVLRKHDLPVLDVILIGKVATACLMTGFCDMLIGYPQVNGLNLTSIAAFPGFNTQTCAAGIFFIYVGCICSAIAAAIYIKEGCALLKRQAARTR